MLRRSLQPEPHAEQHGDQKEADDNAPHDRPIRGGLFLRRAWRDRRRAVIAGMKALSRGKEHPCSWHADRFRDASASNRDVGVTKVSMVGPCAGTGMV